VSNPVKQGFGLGLGCLLLGAFLLLLVIVVGVIASYGTPA
jgi:hypothetical protein